MKGNKLFIIALIPILLIMVYPGLEYSISLGWQTKILTEESIETFIGIGFLLIIACIYWILSRGNNTISKPLTILHFTLTILPIYWLLFSLKIMWLIAGDNMFLLGEFFLNSLLISFLSIIIGQILFFINIGIGIKRKMAAHNTV